MATTDIVMDSDDGPVVVTRGPVVDQVVTRPANAPLSSDHAAGVLPHAQSEPLSQVMDIGSDGREQLAEYSIRLEGMDENRDRLGSAPASTTNMAGVNTGSILLDASASQATQELPETVAYLNEANLAHELDDFLSEIPSNPPLGFDNYLVPLFGAAPPFPSPEQIVLPLLNNAPFPATGRTQWVPDFTFGPPSEHVDIQAFLKNIEGSIELVLARDDAGSVGGLRPEDVAGWTELQELDLNEKKALVDECCVSDLLGSLMDITSDPARLAFVRDSHNQATLSMLGYTTESIKLPPELRDRKKRRSEKVGMVQWGEENTSTAAGEMQQERTSGNIRNGRAAVGLGKSSSRSQASDHTPSGSEDTVMAEPNSVTGNGTVAEPTLSPDTGSAGGGGIRQGKIRVEAEERAVDPLLLDLEDTLKTISLRSWPLPETAKHFIRKPRSSDVNVLTEVRSSPIPFLLPEQVSDNAPPRLPSPGATGVQEQVASISPTQRPHAMIELSILTPAPHPPHTPRHSLSLALLESQTLEDISEALVCANRWIPRSMNVGGGVASGACAVIEGTVYGDGEGDTGGKDYAEKLVEYLSTLKAQNQNQDSSAGLGKRDKDAIVILDEQLRIGLPMLNTRLDSVPWKLHKPYWFMHDGGCVHWIIVSSISLLHQCDPPIPTPEKPSNWPYVTSLSPVPHRALCRVCSRVPAVLAVSGDTRLGESPSLVCEGCWALLGAPRAGRDYTEQGEGLNVLPLVSPDGL
ncbi:hypothetical protein FRC12_004928 [Ceratobasidium sp. 428]|nr:hypothetical protein FRC12_004928 [Ceratobasidium sp. 428]